MKEDHSRRNPAPPSTMPVTITADTSGPASPGICVGHPTPCSTASVKMKSGIHHAQEIRYASPTKAASGWRATRSFIPPTVTA